MTVTLNLWLVLAGVAVFVAIHVVLAADVRRRERAAVAHEAAVEHMLRELRR